MENRTNDYLREETVRRKAALLDLLLTLPEAAGETPYGFFASLGDSADGADGADDRDSAGKADTRAEEKYDAEAETTEPESEEHYSSFVGVSSDNSDDSDDSDDSNRSDNSNSSDDSDCPDDSDRSGLPAAFRAAIAANLERLGGFRAGRRVPDGDWERAFGLLMEAAGAMARGSVGEELLEALLKAVTYDRAVAVADREGEVRGRNALIVERLRRAEVSDGVPALQSSRGGSDTGKRSRSIFDLASEAR